MSAADCHPADSRNRRIPAVISIRSKYHKWHDLIIASAKTRGLDKKALSGYFECHHITPRSLGGKDSPENLVLLTAREHVIVHRLLPRIMLINGDVVGAKKMVYALKKMVNGKDNNNSDMSQFSSRSWSIDKERMSKIPVSDETRRKQSIAKLGTKQSTITKERRSQSLKGHTVTESTRQKISDRNTGKTRSDEFKIKMSKMKNFRGGARMISTFRFISPNGEIFEGYGLGKFCTDKELNVGAMSSVNRGMKRSHKGWKKFND
jgi:hypothetical protein